MPELLREAHLIVRRRNSSIRLPTRLHDVQRNWIGPIMTGPRIFPRDRSPVAAVLLLVGAVAWLGLVVALGCWMGVAR